MIPYLLVSRFRYSTGTLGLYEERLCWWDWKGSCAKCKQPVKAMEGIFCANFCKPRGGLPACRRVWHAKCYGCLGVGKFPIKQMEDEERLR